MGAETGLLKEKKKEEKKGAGRL